MIKSLITSASIIGVGVVSYLGISSRGVALNEYADSNTPVGIETAELVKVVDGDTIKVIYGGVKTNVRILGINTPEKYALKMGYVECFGKESTEFAQEYFSGVTIVHLRRDFSTDNMDGFKRLLRHVYVGTDEYAFTAIKNGYGFYTHTLPVDNSDILSYAESVAKESNLGVWDKCGGMLEKINK